MTRYRFRAPVTVIVEDKSREEAQKRADKFLDDLSEMCEYSEYSATIDVIEYVDEEEGDEDEDDEPESTGNPPEEGRQEEIT